MRGTSRTMFKIFPAIFIAFILALLPVQAVLACKCASGETEQSRFNKADYVAHVKITVSEIRDASELENANSDIIDMADGEYVRVSFEEKEIFKGKKFSPNFLKELPFTNGNCMLDLRPGWEYVIFISKESNGLVGNCSGSFSLYNTNDASTKIQQLREWAKEKR
ncbi:hypothetical protein [Methylomonas rhizoryzae]|uniref:hypothetical protein n=1 Tax=Methylomonas rhizoryzae TaxID=2608981 RepID=UPI001232610C|nr:hypothetical protein [Methylomonas rhizoryzae]